ncbi:MAG: hypothetical protein ACO1SV_12565 [Fimbriimonas sp.]
MIALLDRLPEPIRAEVAPVFEVLPPDAAMTHLRFGAGHPEAHLALAEAERRLVKYPALVAGLWYYADDLDRSHSVSQEILTPEGSYWHGMIHRREGDFSNAKYWFRNAGSLPNRLGLDPIALTDEVASHPRDNPIHLVEAQRREWETLFEHCARQTE